MPKLTSTKTEVTFTLELSLEELNRYLSYMQRLIDVKETHSLSIPQLISDVEALDAMISDSHINESPVISTLSQSQRRDMRAK